MNFTTVTLPSGSIYPAIEVEDGIFLTHPQLSPEKLKDNYEKAVLQALGDRGNRQKVISAAGSGVQYMLPLGKNWLAPMSVHIGEKGEVIALLHYGPA